MFSSVCILIFWLMVLRLHSSYTSYKLIVLMSGRMCLLLLIPRCVKFACVKTNTLLGQSKGILVVAARLNSHNTFFHQIHCVMSLPMLSLFYRDFAAADPFCPLCEKVTNQARTFGSTKCSKCTHCRRNVCNFSFYRI